MDELYMTTYKAEIRIRELIAKDQSKKEELEKVISRMWINYWNRR